MKIGLTRRRNTSTSIFALLLITITALVGHHSIAQTQNNICRYQAAYGGIYENGNSAAIEVNAESAVTVLQDVLSCIRSDMSGTEQENFSAEVSRVGQFPDGTNSTATNLLLSIELAAARNKGVSFEDQLRVARRAYEAISPTSFDSQVLSNQDIRAGLRRNGYKTKAETAIFKSEVLEYQNRCKQSGVPIPPKLNSGDWSGATSLEQEVSYYFFGSGLKKTDIRSFIDKGTAKTSGGFCVALRRSSGGDELTGNDDVPGFGTICTNSTQTAACFFDNVIYKNESETKQLTYSQMLDTSYDQLVHPLDMADSCSNCHRGQNPFIVHGAKNDNPILGKFMKDLYAEVCKLNSACNSASEEFEFVSILADTKDPRNWMNDEMLKVTVDDLKDDHIGRCMSCHDLPDLSWQRRRTFCPGILRNAANKTMPPHADGFVDITTKGVHIGWPSEKDGNFCFPQHDGIKHDFSKYYSSMRAIANFCLTGDFKDPGDCAKTEP